MASKYDNITPDLKDFITDQKIFFVGTAASSGKINVSPKGTDSFRIIDKNKVVWLNLTGSGNETAAHLLKNDRMTIMFCSFEKVPMILRLYGNAKTFHPRDKEYDVYSSLFAEHVGSRQIMEMKVELVQTSCGYAVPLMDFKEERGVLDTWSNKKGRAKIEEYWEEKNSISLDGFETEIL